MRPLPGSRSQHACPRGLPHVGREPIQGCDSSGTRHEYTNSPDHLVLAAPLDYDWDQRSGEARERSGVHVWGVARCDTFLAAIRAAPIDAGQAAA